MIDVVSWGRSSSRATYAPSTDALLCMYAFGAQEHLGVAKLGTEDPQRPSVTGAAIALVADPLVVVSEGVFDDVASVEHAPASSCASTRSNRWRKASAVTSSGALHERIARLALLPGRGPASFWWSCSVSPTLVRA